MTSERADKQESAAMQVAALFLSKLKLGMTTSWWLIQYHPRAEGIQGQTAWTVSDEL